MIKTRTKPEMKSAPSSFVCNESGDKAFIAFRLRNLIALAALGVKEIDYSLDYQKKSIIFLNNLLNIGDENITYDIRLISAPDPRFYSRGEIEIVLLCRMDACRPTEIGQRAIKILDLLRASFDEYEFSAVSGEEIPRLLHPFELDYIVSIVRRCSNAPLDSSQPEENSRRAILSALGIPDSRKMSKKPPFCENILHIFPFIPTWHQFSGFLKLLLFCRYPIALSFRIRPTSLTKREENFIEDQIVRCEDCVQSMSPPRTNLRLLAHIYEQIFIERLYGLRDNTALGSIEIASPQPIPETVINSVGTLITQTAGGFSPRREADPARYLSGGYEVCRNSSPLAVAAFQNVDIMPQAMSRTRRCSLPKACVRLPYLFGVNEAVAFFRFPPATAEATLGLAVQNWRAYPPPKNLPDKGILLGTARHNGACQEVRIDFEDRKKHFYVIGQTGTGKTTLLKTMILDDIHSGEGCCVIDPHGDLFKEILGLIPNNRIDDVVVLDPTDMEFPVGLNMLECETPTQSHFIAQEVVGIVRRLVQDEFGKETQVIGPIFFQHMRMNLLLTMSNPAEPGTLLDFYSIYHEIEFWKRWLPLKMPDPLLKHWVDAVLPQTDYTKPTSDMVSMGAYVSSKFEGFVFDPMLRNIFGQRRSTIDLKNIMDTGKILLVNLAKGYLTEENSRFLGMVLLAKLMVAGMGRVKIPPQRRRQFNLYIDEFQAIATENFIMLLSEARKFGLSLILANQFLTQIPDRRIQQAIFGNVGTIVSFRLGEMDAELLEQKYFPVFNRHDLTNLPNWTAYIKTLIEGEATQPFCFETILDSTPKNEERAKEVVKKSREKFSKTPPVIEEDLGNGICNVQIDNSEPSEDHQGIEVANQEAAGLVRVNEDIS
jgi:energy-coupling factor transporter ATP-binding protein EcfA2